MAWFGGSLNDSLSSLKGQLTKITKDVLSDAPDDDDYNNKQTIENRLSELEAFCASQDLEIGALRSENNELRRQLPNSKVNNYENFDLTDEQLQKICELEDQLAVLKKEKDELQNSLFELDREHELELTQAVKVRDDLKSQFEKLQNEHQILLVSFEELSKPPSHVENDESLQNIQFQYELNIKDNEIGKLKALIEQDNREKEESYQTIKNEILEHESIKTKLEKLISEIKMITDEKSKFDVENKKLKEELELMKNKNDEFVVLLQTNKDLKMKAEANNEEVRGLKSVIEQLEGKLKVICQLDGMNVIEMFDGFVRNSQKVAEETETELQNQVDVLTKENAGLKTEKAGMTSNWAEKEETYKKTIREAQKEVEELKKQQQSSLSQTDDVKRQRQERENLEEMLESNSRAIVQLEKEKNILQTLSEQELLSVRSEKENLMKEIVLWNKTIENKEKQIAGLVKDKMSLEEEHEICEKQNGELKKSEAATKIKLTEIAEANKKLSIDTEQLLVKADKAESLQKELDRVLVGKSQIEKSYNDLKAQIIVKETQLSESALRMREVEERAKEVKDENERLRETEGEAKHWKEVSVDVEVQRQELIAAKEALEREVGNLSGLLAAKERELVTVTEMYKTLCGELEETKQVKNNLEAQCYQLSQQIEQHGVGLEENPFVKENEELKGKIAELTTPVLQHRRSRSAVEFAQEEGRELEGLKATLLQEQTRYRVLEKEYEGMKEQEAISKKELDRLRVHLVEVEDHYTMEAVNNERVLNEMKAKLNAVEEQMRNSSIINKSANVRSNQQVESLQNQIRLMSVQRGDLQGKLSEAEDEVQRHNASLTSLQVVLEQFQQDKAREIRNIVNKYEYQMQLAGRRGKELEGEIEGLKKQLSEAKNGLNAATRLGEQLENKALLIAQLERSVAELRREQTETENMLTQANQSNIGKIDKSLIKNLVVGYVSTPQSDRRLQALRIIASVLDFNQDERNKAGVDSGSSGWLSNILGPKSEQHQSLSEAFIRFLESESRPKPQLKLLPEEGAPTMSRSSSSPPKTPLLLSELVLPTFGSSPSSSILKDVLRDS